MTGTESLPPRIEFDSRQLEVIAEIIEHAAHLLPSQGPIEVFVHHNTLHAFEDHSFHDAVKLGKKVFGGEPYLSELKYHSLIESGRISKEDILVALEEEMDNVDDQLVAGIATRKQIRAALLAAPLHDGNDYELTWLLAESRVLKEYDSAVSKANCEAITSSAIDWFKSNKGGETESVYLHELVDQFSRPVDSMNDESKVSLSLNLLWNICQQEIKPIENMEDDSVLRPRDLVRESTGQDSDTYIEEILIRFCAAFLDRGYAGWELPDTQRGFFTSFVSLYSIGYGPVESWLQQLHPELQRIQDTEESPLQSIIISLQLLGIDEFAWNDFLTQTLLALPGWAGMIWHLESTKNVGDRQIPEGTLIEYLAIRLILERLAIQQVIEEHTSLRGKLADSLKTLKSERPANRENSLRYKLQVFQLCQRLACSPTQLMSLSDGEWQELVLELDAFDSIARRRLLHEAYERNYREQALKAFTIHSRRRKDMAAHNASSIKRPSFQIMCCIDDREESFRRHLEEIDTACETFGAAGFFSVAMYYRGVGDPNFSPLCPAVVTPEHYVVEDVGYSFEGIYRVQSQARRRLGQLTQTFHAGSRTFLGGIVTGLIGSLATFPLVARVIAPRLTSRIRHRFGALLHRPPMTSLQLERYQPEPGPEDGAIGYTRVEMAAIVQRLLEDVGMVETEQFSRVVFICGHGSSSLNNPHESAYCCGACAGKRGGPNARAFAQMANNLRVRDMLAESGLQIPEETMFIGCYHNTCDDSVVYYDLDVLPPGHRADFEHAREAITEARKRNAHERCRRFSSASLSLDKENALYHVESRSEDLSQVRPEYNHATNSMCLVGRREWSRGLFLDRRAFLTSYDPSIDDAESSILLRILSAAIPVCAGINLEYYFSSVDPTVYGSGSKLPHNVASMLGVMEGAISDLRTGLYEQMIEIHEPVRLLFVIESTPSAMLSIMERHEGIRKLCEGGWVQITVLDAESSQLRRYHRGQFEYFDPRTDQLPESQSSLEWYRGERGHLPFCSIRENSVAFSPVKSSSN